MKLPRDVDGAGLARALGKVGYVITRRSGSHIRLSLPGPPQRHLTIPAHASLKVGTLAGILAEVAKQLDLSREELLERIFG